MFSVLALVVMHPCSVFISLVCVLKCVFFIFRFLHREKFLASCGCFMWRYIFTICCYLVVLL